MSIRTNAQVLSRTRLTELLSYGPISGVFWWKVKRGGQKVGSKAGNVDPKGYRHIRIDGRTHRASHLAWLFMTGNYVPMIDHRDRNRSNDKFENLRLSTKSQNNANSAKPANNKSGFKGVSWQARAGKWQATISVNNKTQHLGLFTSAEEASDAYRSAAQMHYGEFANA